MRRPLSRAFTLIELLVTLAIVAILAAGMAIPLFLSNSDDHKLRDAARRLTDMIQFCNSMAVFESAAYRLYFDPPAGQCAVAIERFPLEEPGVYSLYEASGFSLYTLPEGVTITHLIVESEKMDSDEFEEESQDETAETDTEDPYIEFRRDGTADPASIVLSSGGRYLAVTLSGLTSAVRLIENPAVEATLDQELPIGAPTPQPVPGLDLTEIPTETDLNPAPDYSMEVPLLEPTPAETQASTLRDRLSRSEGNTPDAASGNRTSGPTR
jgi:prepilin-type N-terminal cleavage/methylation domain-containing protein